MWDVPGCPSGVRDSHFEIAHCRRRRTSGHCDALTLAIKIFNYAEKSLCLPTTGTGEPIFLRRNEKLHRVIRTSRKGVIIPINLLAN